MSAFMLLLCFVVAVVCFCFVFFLFKIRTCLLRDTGYLTSFIDSPN